MHKSILVHAKDEIPSQLKQNSLYYTNGPAQKKIATILL